MVPYHNPIPERKPPGKSDGTPASGKSEGGLGGMMGAWIQAEKMIQIALMLPSAGFIGWLAGYGLDRWLHQAWMGIAGAVFGIIAGLFGAVRMATAYANDPALGHLDESGNHAGKSGKTEDSDTGS
jgi:F0F1-type ATP synthase assembly protein I